MMDNTPEIKKIKNDIKLLNVRVAKLAIAMQMTLNLNYDDARTVCENLYNDIKKEQQSNGKK